MDANLQKLLTGNGSVQQWLGLEESRTLADGGGADTGGVNALPHGKSVIKPGDGVNPGSILFTPIKRKAGQPWDNAYYYDTITRSPVAASVFSWSLEFSLAPADLKGNGREFEIELCEQGWTFDMAWQAKWSNVDGPPAWRFFDQIKETWVAAMNIPPPIPKANTFIDIAGFFIVDRAAGVTWHDSVLINGTLYPINVSHPKKQKWGPTTNYLHNAVQIDSMGDGVACGVQLLNWNVRAI
jgi:hypothetical protein